MKFKTQILSVVELVEKKMQEIRNQFLLAMELVKKSAGKFSSIELILFIHLFIRSQTFNISAWHSTIHIWQSL